MIDRPRSPQTQVMARVLTEIQGNRLGVAVWLVAAATAVACGGKQLNVGDDQPMASAGSLAMGGTTGVPGHGSGASATGGAIADGPRLGAEELAQIQWPADVACVAAPGSKLVGTWKGHWPDALGGGANDEVVLTITGLTSDGVPCGTVTIGSGPQPPPVADADAIYPPSLGAGGGVGASMPGPVFTKPWPGYEYRMLHVQSTATRLAFVITYNQVLRPWCQLQMAYPDSFSCLPAWTSATGTPSRCTITGPKLPTMEVPCFKMQFCSTVSCFCYDGQCDASLAAQLPFELHWDGAALEGSVNNQLVFLDPVTP
jgi:hypothetical protein